MSPDSKDFDNLNENSFRDSIELVDQFIRANNHLLASIGVFTALLVYISNNIPGSTSETVIGITFASVFGIISILFLVFGYRTIKTINKHGGVGRPATLFVLLLSGLFLGLIGPLSLSINTNSRLVKFLIWYWSAPVAIALSVWALNIVTDSINYDRYPIISRYRLMWVLNFTFIAQYLVVRTVFLEVEWFVYFVSLQRLGIIETLVYYVSIVIFISGLVGVLTIVAAIFVYDD